MNHGSSESILLDQPNVDLVKQNSRLLRVIYNNLAEGEIILLPPTKFIVLFVPHWLEATRSIHSIERALVAVSKINFLSFQRQMEPGEPLPLFT